jgi:hypothetical protein
VDKKIANKLKEQKTKKREEKKGLNGLKVHNSPKVSKQLKGELKKRIELN